MINVQTDYSSNLAAHAVMLKGFFSILFSPNESVLMVPGLHKDRFEALCANLEDWPKEIGGRKTTYYDKELRCIRPRRYLNPFSRSPTSASTRNLAALHEINRQGYDIYFAINPMSCRRRCQKTVTMAKHVLVESDTSDIDVQLRFLKKYEANIVSAVHSGGKSIHCLVRLAPPRLHPRAVGWREANRLGKGETKAPWAEYKQMGDYWIAEAKSRGMEIDTAAAHDHARVSRVPGFLHGKTGGRAEVVRLNPLASWDWRGSVKSSTLVRSSILSIYQHQDDDESFSLLKPKPESFCELWETYKDLKETRGKREPATKNAERATGTQVGSQPGKSSFLDLLDAFDNLRIYGLPGRHVRRSMHRALFETARVFLWNESKMKDEWARVIRKNAAATAETEESAIEDMMRAFNATDDIGIYLPDLTKLPELDEENMKIMRMRLDVLGCTETRKATRIISKVIMPRLKAQPGKCAKGPIGIKSEALKNAANCRGEYRGHKKVWGWMRSASIIKCTNFIYVPGKQARQYRINIPLVIWLCGFRTEELDWSAVPSNCWPQLSRMREINDGAENFRAAELELHSTG